MMQGMTAFRDVHDVHDAWRRGWPTTFSGDLFPRRVAPYKAPTENIHLRVPEQRGGRPYQVPQTAWQLRWRCQMIRHELVESFDDSARLDAHLTGSTIVANYQYRPSAPHPYRAVVFWNENSGIRVLAIEYDRSVGEWSRVVTVKDLEDLAVEAIEDEAYRALQSEVAKHYIRIDDLTDETIDELLATAYDLVDQYGIDAYEAGKWALRELLRANPELKYEAHDRRIAAMRGAERLRKRR